MLLIADSGSTKTDWCYSTGSHSRVYIKTEGINPFHQTEACIRQTIEKQLLPQLPGERHRCTGIYFYGAGCIPPASDTIRNALHLAFPQAEILVETDLLGAARALCHNRQGIACILGTGSNSCLYDGIRIVQNIPPLGYILGDEGSGSYLGKHFLSNCLKGQLSSWLRDALTEELQLDLAGILERVYRQPQANRFLASLTPFIYRHKDNPEVQAFLLQCFDEFFRRNVLPYPLCLPVSFTGSVAWHFHMEIKTSAHHFGLQTGTFLPNPIEGLADYHEIQ